jgi:hypothetical protein
LLEELDKAARELNVSRQAVIKTLVPAGSRSALPDTARPVTALGGLTAVGPFARWHEYFVLIDTIIATRCIESGYELLHNDKDFEPFAVHLGFRVVV